MDTTHMIRRLQRNCAMLLVIFYIYIYYFYARDHASFPHNDVMTISSFLFSKI